MQSGWLRVKAMCWFSVPTWSAGFAGLLKHKFAGPYIKIIRDAAPLFVCVWLASLFFLLGAAELAEMFEIAVDEMVIVVVPTNGRKAVYRILPDSAQVRRRRRRHGCCCCCCSCCYCCRRSRLAGKE